MIRGIYIAASGLNLQQALLDVTANNLANLSTPGFKQDRLTATTFAEVLLYRLEREGITAIGTTNYGTLPERSYTDFTQGALVETGNYRDVALVGEGFLVADTPQGIRYFRSGTLFVDREGYLTTATGDRVLGEGRRPIQVGEESFTILPDGTVEVAGRTVGRLLVVRIINPQQREGELPIWDSGILAKEGRNYYRLVGGSEAPAVGTLVRQGWLEAANVDLAGEMARLCTCLRAYQLASRALKTHDELLNRIINQTAKNA
ncbi:fagellar hook-basal body protein [Ammonifex degensii KC4]|uniref:Fagellar hook-basal body protein n=1 Tax=Ammonifex degensii (strain DSM 10501 / KC4) TaxID=429009 RepID=C9R9X2_AMMDK|nr:flagellar hook-basal body protein [Ammonifex degensii]ACX53101.1 fagellar hook-basal body protein [Ammonifex degensii KC4]